MFKFINNLKPSESKDIYDNHSGMHMILKTIAVSIHEPLTYCVNKCINEFIFPDELKLSSHPNLKKRQQRNSCEL